MIDIRNRRRHSCTYTTTAKLNTIAHTLYVYVRSHVGGGGGGAYETTRMERVIGL